MSELSFALGEKQEMVLEAVRGMLRKVEPKREQYLRMIYEEQRFPDELWEAMVEAGIIGALVPEQYGGTGLGLTGMALAIEEMSNHGLASAFCILTTMANMAILRGGSEAQRAYWMPKVADGTAKFAFAITEPDCGTNSFRMRSMATRDGDGYRLNGSKGWITGADVADYILVVARTMSYDEIKARGLPRTAGLGLFIIDGKAKGLELQAMDTAGIEGYQQFMLYFDDVEVPLERRIGEEHAGAGVLFTALNPERILAGAVAVGMSEFALRKAVAYAKERVVFGDSPIGTYQAVQHPLARVKVEQEAARLLTYKAAWLFDQGRSPMEVGHAANMAKLFSSEMVVKAVDAAIQAHGGNGFVREYHLINLWAPARLLKTAPINNEMILNQLSEHLLGLPRSY
jgi:alkylation response protein AidB-like acyl-CoA dehydrogenase